MAAPGIPGGRTRQTVIRITVRCQLSTRKEWSVGENLLNCTLIAYVPGPRTRDPSMECVSKPLSKESNSFPESNLLPPDAGDASAFPMRIRTRQSPLTKQFDSAVNRARIRACWSSGTTIDVSAPSMVSNTVEVVESGCVFRTTLTLVTSLPLALVGPPMSPASATVDNDVTMAVSAIVTRIIRGLLVLIAFLPSREPGSVDLRRRVARVTILPIDVRASAEARTAEERRHRAAQPGGGRAPNVGSMPISPVAVFSTPGGCAGKEQPSSAGTTRIEEAVDFALEHGKEVLRRTPDTLRAMLSELSEDWIS